MDEAPKAGDARSFAPHDEGGGREGERLKALAAKALRRTSQELRVWADARADEASEAVEHRPITAIAAALGVGVVIGLLSRR